MPVCSYLVFPRPEVDDLARQLTALPGCEATSADNAEVLILVTDTPDDAAEQQLQTQLAAIEGIQCMVLTFGDISQTEVVTAQDMGHGRQ